MFFTEGSSFSLPILKKGDYPFLLQWVGTINHLYYGEETIRACIMYGRNKSLFSLWNPGFSREEWCLLACERKNLPLLVFLHQNGCCFSRAIFAKAVEVGAVDCLRYANETFPKEFGTELCDLAAQNGNLACLQYLSTVMKCPADEHTLEYAAKNGHLHCVQFLYENGCSWLPTITQHPRCVEYMKKSGWIERMTQKNDHLLY